MLGWRIARHPGPADLAKELRGAEYPPYFYCVKDRHMVPLEVLMAVADTGGYLYEGLPGDALGLFRLLTTAQAWTAACTEAQLDEARGALRDLWGTLGKRTEAHAPPSVVHPPRRRDDDFGSPMGGFDPDRGLDLSSTSDSESDDEPAAKAGAGGAKFAVAE